MATMEERPAPLQAQEADKDGIAVDDQNSAYGGDDSLSETTSLASSLIKGHIENGRKYTTLRNDYWGPSDDKQFETMDAGHFTYLVLDSQEPNSLFYSPLKSPKHILDIGTGPGTWAIDAADKFPDALVTGVDLMLPPAPLTPPNCTLEVDDVLLPWTWKKKFDLIHMRLMLGAWTDSERADVYKKCFDSLHSGGWIEEVEPDIRVMSDDGSLRKDSLLASWGQNFLDCAERAGRPLSTQLTMKAQIEAAGFVDVQEKVYKSPIGRWPKDKVLKEAGGINFVQWSSGLEGYAMFLLTRFGDPPLSADQVREYVAKVRDELKNPDLHIWHYARRVWGRRP